MLSVYSHCRPATQWRRKHWKLIIAIVAGDYNHDGKPDIAAAGDQLLKIWWAVQDSNLRPPACKAGFAAIEKVPLT